MNGRWIALLPAAAVLGWGCTGPSLVASVEVPVNLKSTCVRVVALADGAEITSQLILRPATAEPLAVAIFEPQGQSREVTAVARGYVGAGGCAEPLLLNEESDPAAAQFRSGAQEPILLTLRAPPPALDADGDGFRAASAGGPDCDDRRASVQPGASESCGDAVDNDCDQQVDCQEASCQGQPCGGGLSCTAQGLCEGVETQCANAQDDDLDGAIDCLDPDCSGASCDDGDLCTTGDACQAGQCSGDPVTCTGPAPGQCFNATGTCNPADGGCRYPPAPGRSCGGASVCDHDGGCGPLYRYPTTNFTSPDAGAFLPLRFDCGVANLDTTPAVANPFTGQLCGQTAFPTLIDRTQIGAGNAVIVPVEQLTVAAGSELRVSGTRPVIFAVFGDAQIDGRLWFQPAPAAANGPGTTVAQCGPGRGANGGNTAVANTSGGGGSGGGYGSAGAVGGGGVGTLGGTPGGGAFGPSSLSPLHGGCTGGRGGNNGGGNMGADPGGAGGAIQISATESVIVRGTVGVPGAGGNGGRNHQSGAGGGGSGGAILLEGRSVRVTQTGRLTANGGGGGAGDSCCASGILDGSDGNDGALDGFNNPANGGNSEAGGAGGRGASGPQNPNPGGNGNVLSLPGTTYQGAGGGGGGGLGRIRVNAYTGCQLDGGISGAGSSNWNADAGCL